MNSKYDNQMEKYTPIIQNIINENRKFYGFNDEIKWEFFFDENVDLIATATKNLKLKININSVEFAYKNNEPLVIEQFILHEIRHIWQRLFVQSSRLGYCCNEKLAAQYEFEFNNYCNIYQDKEIYYNQQIEFEAFIFSYSVMRYKYGNISYITYPKFYDEKNINIQNYVDKWINSFESLT